MTNSQPIEDGVVLTRKSYGGVRSLMFFPVVMVLAVLFLVLNKWWLALLITVALALVYYQYRMNKAIEKISFSKKEIVLHKRNARSQIFAKGSVNVYLFKEYFTIERIERSKLRKKVAVCTYSDLGIQKNALGELVAGNEYARVFYGRSGDSVNGGNSLLDLFGDLFLNVVTGVFTGGDN